MKMIKIAYDYQIFGAQKYGGISRYFYELAKNLNKISYPACWYEPENSMLLIFRSNLIHMVEKNNSNDDRISISMNFKFND